MKNMRMIVLAIFLALAAGLLCGCDGHQNPSVPQQLPETVPATTAATEPTQAPASTEPQPSQTKAATQPALTEATTQPTEPEPVLLEPGPEERCEINIFLSNFSEQWFHEAFRWDDDTPNEVFYADTGSITEIVDFVWLFAKLNCYSELEMVLSGDDYYYGFKLGVLNSIAERFFGRSLTEADLQAAESEYYFLLDGMVCGPAADGETYMNMTVTEELYDLGNGTLRAEFAIYDAWAFAELGDPVSGTDLYCLTGEQARNDPNLVLHLKGAAVLRPHTLADGRESYQLVSYELYDPAT